MTGVELKIKTLNQTTGEMEEVICAEAALNKDTSGPSAGDVLEENIYIAVSPGKEPNYSDAIIAVNTECKLTKADAGFSKS